MAFPRQMVLGSVVALAFLALAGASFAGCATESYQKACASCQFDANGKIDKSCQSGYQSSGTACVSTSYPVMAAKYAEGKCPQVDDCASELRSCTAQYSTGDDKADCAEGSVAVCYSAADVCTNSAAAKCSDIENPCKAPAAVLVMLFAGLAFIRIRK